MHFQGKEAISVVTQRSARTLLATALLIGFTEYYDVPVSKMEVFGVKLPIEVYTHGAIFVLVLLVINHFVHWYGDYISYRNWNKKEKVNGVAMVSTGASIVPHLDKVIELNEGIVEAYNKVDIDSATKNHLSGLSDQFKHFNNELEAIRQGVTRLNTFAGFYIYGWQLTFPILAAGVAFGMAFFMDNPP